VVARVLRAPIIQTARRVRAVVHSDTNTDTAAERTTGKRFSLMFDHRPE